MSGVARGDSRERLPPPQGFRGLQLRDVLKG